MNDSSSSSVPFEMKNKLSMYCKYVIVLSLMYGGICVNSIFPIKNVPEMMLLKMKIVKS